MINSCRFLLKIAVKTANASNMDIIYVKNHSIAVFLIFYELSNLLSKRINMKIEMIETFYYLLDMIRFSS